MITRAQLEIILARLHLCPDTIREVVALKEMFPTLNTSYKFCANMIFAFTNGGYQVARFLITPDDDVRYLVSSFRQDELQVWKTIKDEKCWSVFPEEINEHLKEIKDEYVPFICVRPRSFTY